MNRNNPNSGTVIVRPAQVVSRLTPWSEFEQMRRQMDEVLNGLLRSSNETRPTLNPMGLHTNDMDIAPDIYETPEEIIFVAPIPGIDAADLKIEATADTLVISGERKPFFQHENAKQHRQSWWSARTGTFEFAYTLPFEINPDAVRATTRNGVLELHLPKAEAAKPKPVTISVDAK